MGADAFVRMLKLPDEVRAPYDISSLKVAFHAAAPCPVPVKEQMIDWWGPIIREYYAGTEGNGFTAINSDEWLSHRGSVGQALIAEVMICDEEAIRCRRRRRHGLFRGGGEFEYHNDPKRPPRAATRRQRPRSATSAGWTRRAISTSPTARVS